jgi:hypothetical protein
MKITDICSVASDGRVAIDVDGTRVLLPAGCRVHALSAFGCWIIGALTPGVTTPRGIGLSENLLPLLTVETVCHEATHWWQANKRMGAIDYVSTYLWQAFVVSAILKGKVGHWHDSQEMEVEARRHGQAMAALGTREIDVEAYLAAALTPTQ